MYIRFISGLLTGDLKTMRKMEESILDELLSSDEEDSDSGKPSRKRQRVEKENKGRKSTKKTSKRKPLKEVQVK